MLSVSTWIIHYDYNVKWNVYDGNIISIVWIIEMMVIYAQKLWTVHMNDSIIYALYGGIYMRTTLDLPESLIQEAMDLTRIKTKTEVIKTALQNLIQKEKVKDLKKYYGKIDLDIDLDTLRNR